MDSKARFSNRVANYAKYRPGYPHGVLEYLSRAVGLSRGSAVADVGSGTGILTSLLLDAAKIVYAVEPNPEMRLAAEALLKNRNNFVSVDGSAEDTHLAAKSVDLVTVAQAFHWFDRQKTKAEFVRVLKSGGKVVLIWNNRETVGDAFSEQYEELLRAHAIDYNEVNHMKMGDEDFKNVFRNGKYESAAFENRQPEMDFDMLLGRVLSASYVPLPGEGNYDDFVERLKRIFEKTSRNGRVVPRYTTVLYWGEI
jgi:SAM-dependent methyltransferase